MEFERALSDLEEVRHRLARAQRFAGYSGPAAAASGVAALVAGLVQQRAAPLPKTPDALHAYLVIWMACLVAALALNYGTVAVWVLKNRGPGARSRFHTAALSIAPSIVLGGAVSLALVDRADYTLLPGTWFALYAIGLFASSDAIPRPVLGIAGAFAALAAIFLLTPFVAFALAWWVLPLGFGVGQVAIGYLIWQERAP
jgi:hypothetical protein